MRMVLVAPPLALEPDEPQPATTASGASAVPATAEVLS
jgi:hypothetical protein